MFVIIFSLFSHKNILLSASSKSKIAHFDFLLFLLFLAISYII